MVDAATVRRLALELPDTVEAPHFNRTAFKVKRIYATMGADTRELNLSFDPGEQAMQVEMAPHLFRPVANAWGQQGWTIMQLGQASEADVRHALSMAHAHATGAKRKG